MVWMGVYSQTFLPPIGKTTASILSQSQINVPFRVEPQRPVVGQVGNLRTDCQSVQPGEARPARSSAAHSFACFSGGLSLAQERVESPARSRAVARLDRLPIGPQVTNLPHTVRGSWIDTAGTSARATFERRLVSNAR